ncbi:MAG: adenylate/guanylate cyclase domain-containing protein [Pseudomonadota bacterium]
MLNLFLLIALRALRFESRFVIAAGTAAILGWSALVGYVVFSDPADPMVTRDYVTYLTSNSVLIGSEIAKLISLLFFTLILAIAVRQGHNLLVNSISEQAAAQSLSRFFDESVADTIKSSDQQIEAGRGISRDAAILMVDIRGFTRLASQIPSDQAMALLSEYQSKLVPIIQRHGGTIDKFMGDGIMATFGVVHPSATYCADALKAVQALLDEASSWQTDPLLGTLQPRAVNAAVASGPVIFGAVGNSERLEYTVIGTPVNLAAKIEKLNKDHGTLAIATHTAFSTALDQGFRALANPEPLNFEVGKEADAVPCVVLAR